MPSPFPGMDPYLEAHWRDVHARLVIYAGDALQTFLPAALRARVEERVLLETPKGIGDHPLFPDVRVVEYTSKRGLETRPGTDIAVAEPVLVQRCQVAPSGPGSTPSRRKVKPDIGSLNSAMLTMVRSCVSLVITCRIS